MRISKTLGEAPVEQEGFRQSFCCRDHIQTVSRLIKSGVESYTFAEKHLTASKSMQSYKRSSAEEWTCAIYEHGLTEGDREGDKTSPKLFTPKLWWKMKSLDWNENGMGID